MKEINYLGVKVNYLVNKDTFNEVFKNLLKKGYSKIYTVNPEFIVDAYFDTDFRKELNSSDINIVDGVGLLKGIKKYFKRNISKEEMSSIKTFTGVDLVEEVLKQANENNYSVFLLGGSEKNQVALKSVKSIKIKYPNIKFVGGTSKFSFQEEDDTSTLDFIKNFLQENSLKELDIILVAYGHKKQEFWIKRNSSKIPARISIGVGGTFDYMSGNIKRAPKWLRDLGLEWLYRFITQPSRIFRIFKAVVIFSYLSNKINNASNKN
jgi:N-acetylglucosaminyldiphosphoundecaprenol N-acetyl-beta-D-mannosaminyltransferase